MSLHGLHLQCVLQTHNFLGDVVVHIFCPLLTAEAFAEASGLPLGVVEAQLDRRILPVVRLGKRRMVNVEALRIQALQKAADSGLKDMLRIPDTAERSGHP